MTATYINTETFQPFVEVEMVPRVNGQLQEDLSFSVYLPVEPMQDAIVMSGEEKKELMKDAVATHINMDLSVLQKTEI
jgi:hypothetical protein